MTYVINKTKDATLYVEIERKESKKGTPYYSLGVYIKVLNFNIDLTKNAVFDKSLVDNLDNLLKVEG